MGRPGLGAEQDTGPAARKEHALAFDAARQRVVLFGGDVGAAANAADTCAYDGTAWTQLEDIGPGPCASAAAVFGAGSVLLFGGMAGTPATVSGLTWQWDGEHWTLRQDIGPVPRWGHAVAFDADRGRAVLFGGASVVPDDAAVADHVLGDTWEEVDEGAAAEPPNQPPPAGVTLISFTINPDTGTANDSVSLEVQIDQPAPAPVTVQISSGGGVFTGILIATGSDTGQEPLMIPPPEQSPPGDYELGVELGGQTLSAILHII